MQLPLWTPDTDWTPPTFEELPSTWKGVARMGIDTETCDPQLKQMGIGVRRDGRMVGISFAIEDGPSYYLPFGHEGGDNLDQKQVLSYIKAMAKTFDGELVGANISYDLDYLWDAGVAFPNIKYYRDIQVADPLIYELHHNYSLKHILERHNLPGKDETKLLEAAKAYGVDPKGGLWKLPARFVGEYAEADAVRPLQALRRQERIIDENDLWDIYNLESKVTPVLVKMRQRGVRVDFKRLEKIERWSLTQEAEALDFVGRETGIKLTTDDVWKSDAIAPALKAIGMVLEKTSKGSYSVRADLLDDADHPVATAIKHARKVNKLRTTFAASVRRYAIGDRIHCTYNQIAREDEKGEMKGVRYGRLSCVDPNLQQQPSRDEFAQEWRSIYLPEEGERWASNDYSQQEPRWTTHFAAIMDLKGAREAAQAYHDDPMIDNHAFMAKITGIDRKFAKAIYLGLCYGEGGAKLCDELVLPTRWAIRPKAGGIEYYETRDETLHRRAELGNGFIWRAAGVEGQGIIDTFDKRAPFIRLLATEAKKQAQKRGYVITDGGRRLHFPRNDDGSYDWTHKALNRVIQGSGADQMKKGMVEIDAAGFWLMLQIHDETASSVKSMKEAKQIAEIMAETRKARVPFRVDTELGDNWGDSM